MKAEDAAGVLISVNIWKVDTVVPANAGTHTPRPT
jgi:hypothetical protein